MTEHAGPPGHLGDLLVADDDGPFLDLLVRVFAQDFTVHAAADGGRAMDILEKLDPVAILVDEMMPRFTGTQVLARAKALRPNAARMLMTASTEFDRAVSAINLGEIHRFFAKPLRPMELKGSVKDVVQRVRDEHLLRVELETLRNIRAPQQVVQVVVVAANHGLRETLAAACAARGYAVVQEGNDGVAKAILANRQVDMVVVARENGVDVLGMLKLARGVDETMSTVVVDTEPSVTGMQHLMDAGAQDVLPVPLPSPELLAARLERAVHRRLVLKDMQRVTGDLLAANRQLALARRKQEEQQVRVLNTMVRALEARDAYTAGHTDRVAAISVRLAGILELAPERVEHVRMGALLHDIGKIGIRDAVLLEPGSLSPEEFSVIKTHTTFGDAFIKDVDQFRCVAPIVRSHHERLDGSGYPDGLSGESIPFEARIVAVADILDAITSTRPYRTATSLESAYDVLYRLEGTALDPRVCAALRELHAQGRVLDLLQNPASLPPLPV